MERSMPSSICNHRSAISNPGRFALPLCHAFTLLELLLSITIVCILAVLSIAGIGQVKPVIQGSYCANSLRQLGLATTMYLNDHQHKCFAYAVVEPAGKLWYFGFETWGSIASPEGDRIIDQTQAPIYPYVEEVGGVQVCPSFPYGQAIWKPKYQGASWGYGFNTSSPTKIPSTSSTPPRSSSSAIAPRSITSSGQPRSIAPCSKNST